MKRKIIKKEKVTLESLSTSIDNLAMAVGKGFERVDEKFGNLENRFDGLETNLNDFKNTTKYNFIEVNDKLTSLDKRLTVVEVTLPPIVNIQTVQSHEIRELNMRVGKIEKKLAEKKN